MAAACGSRSEDEAAEIALVRQRSHPLVHIRRIDRLIWAVDYPYLSLDGTRKFLESLPITEDEKHKIAHLNAERLFHL